MAPGRRETPRYVPCDCPVTPCRAPYSRPNLPCSAPPTTTRAAPFTLLYTRQKITAPLCFLSSPADFAGIRADSPCKRRRAPPRAPRGVAVTRYTAGNSGPRSAVTPEVPAHRRPRGPGAPPSGTHRPHLGAILGETASSAKNLFPTNSFVWGFLKSDSQGRTGRNSYPIPSGLGLSGAQQGAEPDDAAPAAVVPRVPEIWPELYLTLRRLTLDLLPGSDAGHAVPDAPPCTRLFSEVLAPVAHSP